MFWNRYGTWILAGLTAAALLALLLQYRARSEEASRVAAAESLSMAREEIDSLRQVGLMSADANQVMTARQSVADRVEPAIDSILSTRTDAPMLADALALRGDLHLLLSRKPPTTQPSTTEPDLTSHTASAKDAYQQVLDRFAGQAIPVASARMGLAAIAEDASDWPGAQKHYEAIAANMTLPKSVRDLATKRINTLAGLQKPVYQSPPRPAATEAPDPAGTPTAMEAPDAGATPPTDIPAAQIPAVEAPATADAAATGAIVPPATALPPNDAPAATSPPTVEAKPTTQPVGE